jgi:hypothetical protein
MRRERGRFRFHRVPAGSKAFAEFLPRRIRLPMLPGFRFLLSAIILSMSILIFGLGAAALLRAAHEEFASNPTWRAPPEAVFAQPNETARPVLATLVVVAPPAELKQPETQVAAAPEAPAVIASLPAEPEQAAGAEPALASPIVAARSETLAESSPSSEPAPVQANPAQEASATETRIAAVDKIDAIEATPPPAGQPTPAAPEQASAPAGPEIDKTTTKIATLEDPPVAVEVPANAASMEADKSAAKKRLRARRARQRRRLAALHRAMLEKQAALQPATDLFGQAIIGTAQTTIASPASASTAGSGRTGRDRRAIGLPPLRP